MSIGDTYQVPNRSRPLANRHRIDRWFVTVCLTTACLSVVILAVLLFAILAQGLPALSWRFC